MNIGDSSGPFPGDDGGVDHGPPSWCEAWARAATGPAGFWRSSSPAAHFRTASTLGPELAEAVAALLIRHPEVVERINAAYRAIRGQGSTS